MYGNSPPWMSRRYYCVDVVYFLLPIFAFLHFYNDIPTIIMCGQPYKRITVYIYIFYLYCAYRDILVLTVGSPLEIEANCGHCNL